MDYQILYSPEQAAKLLAIGRSKLFELMAAGDIDSLRIGRSRRITHSALEAYAAQLAAEQLGGRPRVPAA